VIDQRVLERRGLVAQGRGIHQGGEPEHVPLGAPHDEVAFRVAQFQRPAAHDVQLRVGFADGQHPAAGLVIADLYGPGGGGELPVVEFLETRQVGQETADLGQFVHVLILTRLAPT
jgi:hypothetical protein